jgi:hypothetical protein
MPKDAYYFSHDCNAKDDPKCVALIEQLGLEGYGIYWVLIEILRDQPEYKYPLSLIPAIARKYNTTAEKIKVVVNAYGLFVIDENDFFSPSLINRMETFEELRLKKSLAGKKGNEIRWNKQLAIAEESQCESQCDNIETSQQSQIIAKKGKKSKVNKSKVDESILNEYTSNEMLGSTINDFISMRHEMKKPMTEHAIRLLLKKLDEFANDDETKIRILEKSILNGWQGIFELKEVNGFYGRDSGNNRQASTTEKYDFSKYSG